jgi:hypothetical protein
MLKVQSFLTKEQIEELAISKFSETGKKNLSQQETHQFITEVLLAMGYPAESINLNSKILNHKDEIGFEQLLAYFVTKVQKDGLLIEDS